MIGLITVPGSETFGFQGKSGGTHRAVDETIIKADGRHRVFTLKMPARLVFKFFQTGQSRIATGL